MFIRKTSLEEFDRPDITFDDLTYEKMVGLWCVSNFSDSFIAMKCGVPKDKISRLRRDKYKINMMNTSEHVGIVFGSDISLDDEADAIVAHVFRNGYLEDLHAGISVEKKFLNPKYSRITDDEMKKLMIECRGKMKKLLQLKEENLQEYKKFLKQTHKDYCKRREK